MHRVFVQNPKLSKPSEPTLSIITGTWNMPGKDNARLNGIFSKYAWPSLLFLQSSNPTCFKMKGMLDTGNEDACFL